VAPDEREVRELHSIWIDAVNAGDLARLLTLMTDDVVFLNPGRAPLDREGFSANFPAAHERARISCRDSLSVIPRDGGEAIELAGYRITVYRKQPDGRWLLARDAHTLS
jgi:ketosteroid isomerase-like protein